MEVFVIQAVVRGGDGWLYKIFSTKERALEYLNQYPMCSKEGAVTYWMRDFGQYYVCHLYLETWAVDNGETE